MKVEELQRAHCIPAEEKSLDILSSGIWLATLPGVLGPINSTFASSNVPDAVLSDMKGSVVVLREALNESILRGPPP